MTAKSAKSTPRPHVFKADNPRSEERGIPASGTMADARALLKQQRAARRITHPYAQYTESGKLLCTLCTTVIKSESAWTAHLKSSDHATRALRAAEASKTQAKGKKRKAEDEAEEDEVARSDGEGEGRKRVDVEGARSRDETPALVAEAPISGVAESKPTLSGSNTAQADEDDPEWLELQTFLTTTKAQDAARDPNAAVALSAPAMTAAEIAARAREEQSVQRGKREKEIEEEEKEDAAARLEEEADEMGGLEERVKALRERREALRSKTEAEASVGSRAGDGVVEPGGETREAGGDAEQLGEDEDNDDDDEFDEWDFGGGS